MTRSCDGALLYVTMLVGYHDVRLPYWQVTKLAGYHGIADGHLSFAYHCFNRMHRHSSKLINYGYHFGCLFVMAD